MILVLGLYFSRSVTEKVSQVYFEEKKLRSNLIDIKAKIEELKFIGQTEGELLQNHNQMLDQLLDNLRYLSPSNNERAVELESSILLELSNIQMAMKEGGKANEIQEMLMRCDLIYRQRKQLYSK